MFRAIGWRKIFPQFATKYPMRPHGRIHSLTRFYTLETGQHDYVLRILSR